MKRLILTLPLALYPLLAGCPSPTEPPAAPPGNPPAISQPAGLPDMPPDPRAGQNSGNSSRPAANNPAVGSTTLPAKPVNGSALNKFFPQGVTYTQEKSGYSMANLKGGGTLAISDLAGNPPARDKYNISSLSIAGYPATKSGTQGVSILVGDRYQVTVRGTANAEAALSSADLSGLAALK